MSSERYCEREPQQGNGGHNNNRPHMQYPANHPGGPASYN